MKRAATQVHASSRYPVNAKGGLSTLPFVPTVQAGSPPSFDLQTSPGHRQRMARVYGPERFFYDQSTFTGVHRHG
eukprot:1814249-Rhodomonas_salina.2